MKSSQKKKRRKGRKEGRKEKKRKKKGSEGKCLRKNSKHVSSYFGMKKKIQANNQGKTAVVKLLCAKNQGKNNMKWAIKD